MLLICAPISLKCWHPPGVNKVSKMCTLYAAYSWPTSGSTGPWRALLGFRSLPFPLTEVLVCSVNLCFSLFGLSCSDLLNTDFWCLHINSPYLLGKYTDNYSGFQTLKVYSSELPQSYLKNCEDFFSEMLL